MRPINLKRIGLAFYLLLGLFFVLCLAMAAAMASPPYYGIRQTQLLVTLDNSGGGAFRYIVDSDGGHYVSLTLPNSSQPGAFAANLDGVEGTPGTEATFMRDGAEATSVQARATGSNGVITRMELDYALGRLQTDDTSGEALIVMAVPYSFRPNTVRMVVTGAELTNPACAMVDLSGGRDENCAVTNPEPGVYEVELDVEDIEFGSELQFTATPGAAVANAAATPLSVPSSSLFLSQGVTALLAALGFTLGAVGIFWWVRRNGSNQVAQPDGTVTLVPDSKMPGLAQPTLDLPRDLLPWQGRVVATERAKGEAVLAYIADLESRGILQITLDVPRNKRGLGPVTIGSGPNLAAASPFDQLNMSRLLSVSDPFTIGVRVKRAGKFTQASRQVARELRIATAQTDWWTRGNPGRTNTYGFNLLALGAIEIALLFLGGIFGVWMKYSSIGRIGMGVSFSLALMLPLMLFLIHEMNPGYTTQGSRRALDVAALSAGLAKITPEEVRAIAARGELRQYCAWAVATTQHVAMQNAIAGADLPPEQLTQTMNLQLPLNGFFVLASLGVVRTRYGQFG